MDQQQLARIRLLSSRFRELQGLRVAFAGGTMAIVSGSYLMATTAPTSSGAMIALLASFVLMIPGEWWLHRHYARTVGRQVPTPRNPWPVVAFVTIYLAIGIFLDSRFPEIPSGAPTMATVVLASLVVAIRDWPWRAHYLGVAAAVTVAFCANVFGDGVVDPGMTLTTVFFVTGLSFVPAGLLDHRLLLRLMEEGRQPETATAGDS
jgi:hypothetical protein